MIRRNETSAGQAPARRRLGAAERRGLILAAATRAFAEHGYAGASIQRIAKGAGVVASVVYDHFGSKRELYLQLLEQHGQNLIQRSAQSSPSSSPSELLRLNLEAFYGFVEEHPFVWRMLFRDPPADNEIAALHRDIQRRASQAIAALIGSVRPDEQLIGGLERTQANVMLAEAIKAVNDGLAAWWFEHRDISRAQVIAVAQALLWTGLARVADATSDDA
jgi:AcrR family transcriptional regulator